MPSDTMKSPNHIEKKVTSMDNDTRTLLNLTDPHLNLYLSLEFFDIVCKIKLESKKLKGLLTPLSIPPLVFYFYLVYNNHSFNFLRQNTFICILTRND